MNFKYLFAITFSISLFFLGSHTSPVLADGTFDCKVVGASCMPVNVSCGSGFKVDLSVCNNTSGVDDCNAITGHACIGENEGAGGQFNGPKLENGCGIRTALGCIPIDSEQGLAKFFLSWGMGIGGGIALILMVVASFSIMTSGGDPRKLQAGKELLTSALMGLVMLVFAAYILKFIGVDLFGIFN
jgi:hypothetical protein